MYHAFVRSAGLQVCRIAEVHKCRNSESGQERKVMADVRPFKAIRPEESKASKIAALPYDVMNRNEAKAEIRREPLSFLQIDRAETNFPDSVDTYDPAVYEKASAILQKMIKSGSFIQDDKPCYYIYELTMQGRSQTGIAAVCSADDYDNRVIRKHENTREDKEIDRIKHVEACSAQTGPIFLAYRKNDVISEVVSHVKKVEKPVYDFKADDGITHRVWIISLDHDIEKIRDAFSGIGSIYIADGHHRCASAVKVCMKKRAAAGQDYNKDDEYNFFLSVLFPDEELMIMDYNRVVKDLNGLSEERFLDRIRKKFAIEKIGHNAYHPVRKGNIGMYISGCWYSLTAKDEIINDDPVEGLDVSLLQNEVLAPILNIEDPKTDRRIDFIGGIRGLNALERRVNSGEAEVAFAMYPTSIAELFAVADAGELMPPKSTWFEPKLRSGLFIHKF